MLRLTHWKNGDYRVQTWKNGQGKTTELAVDTEEPYRWRLSYAALSGSGPFSLFPGYDRKIVLLRGGPVTLQHSEGPSRLLATLAPYAFAGELATTAQVAAAGQDFNVFTLRSQATSGVYRASLGNKEEVRFPLGAHEHFLFCIQGKMEVLEQNQHEEFWLLPGEMLQLSRSSPQELMNLRAAGCGEVSSAVWVTIQLPATGAIVTKK